MDLNDKEVSVEFPNLIRVYKDGSVERLFASPHVPPCPEDSETGVASKDLTISIETGLSARLYLPKLTNPTQKLPILVYFHGGGFCLESAFSFLDHRYMNLLASQGPVLVVSVEYRLAPEHPLPAAYEDCWTALNWVADQQHDEQWLTAHGDLDAIFVGGDSAGGNIVHNIAMRAGSEELANGVKILGAFASHPFFLDGPKQEMELTYKIWEFVYPNAPGGSDCYMINPFVDGSPSLARLGCERVLVLISGKDELRDIGYKYFEAVKGSGYEGKVELFETEGEGHCFHIFDPHTQKAKLLLQCLASFIRK